MFVRLEPNFNLESSYESFRHDRFPMDTFNGPLDDFRYQFISSNNNQPLLRNP